MDQPSLSDDLSLGCSRWDTFAHSLADSSAEGDSWLRDFIDLNSDSAPHPCRPRGTHARLPRCAVKVLEGWLAEHRQHPYASRAEQDELATQTDLDRRQIRSWLSNARKRRKESLAEAEPPVLFPPHLHPFERWLYSDLEYDGTNPTALHQAIINQREGRAPNTFMVDDLPYGTGLRWGPARADSVTSIEIRSYAANEESVASADWKDTELRKPVRRQSKKAPPKSQMPSKPVRLFQCTFCGRSFSKNHDWQRHEKSQHLPLDRWICCCEGSEYVDPATNRASCVFCDAYDPSVEHMSQHGYTRCVNRPLEERTFFRKDHLSQHLRLLHGCQFMPAMEQWRTVTTELQSRCGFCTEIFSTWAERVVHLAEHFKGGSTMQDWRGNWGFDEPIEQVVERATLPEERSHCPRGDDASFIYPDEWEEAPTSMTADEWTAFSYGASATGDSCAGFPETDPPWNWNGGIWFPPSFECEPDFGVPNPVQFGRMLQWTMPTPISDVLMNSHALDVGFEESRHVVNHQLCDTEPAEPNDWLCATV